jgi:hypothetical protein
MARAKPMVLDFSRGADYGHRVMFNALPHPIEVSGPTTITIDTDGQLDHWHPRCDPRIPLINREPVANYGCSPSQITQPLPLFFRRLLP